MSLAAKPVYLEVRPFQVSHLCFEVGGILGESFTELGAKVSAFDFDGIYKAFRSAEGFRPDDDIDDEVDLARLRWSSDRIDLEKKRAAIGGHPFALAALRAEPLRAALDKAINVRANAFITKYANAEGIVAGMRKVLLSKSVRLDTLVDNSQTQTALLDAAYRHDGRVGVVRTTESISDIKTDGTSTTTEANGSQTSKSHTEDNGGEKIRNTDYGYRVPDSENLARNERALINLSDEGLSLMMQIQGLERMEEVFKNELASIDTDINQLQIAYLNTILMSPIQGTVTGVYKNPGDSVRPGEPVFRVENNAVVLVVAKLICRGPILIGSFLKVQTMLFDLLGLPVSIMAPIVAARSQGADDGWEVIAKFSNLDAAGKSTFPLGYHFDYDNTTVEIFGAGEFSPIEHPKI